MTTTMLPMPSQIEIYQEMSALSTQMVEAAQCQDWDRLVALETAVSTLRNTLIEDNANVAAGERELKSTLIQRILDNDAEIRRHTEPWMEHVRQFLGDGVKKRQVEQAYGASRP